MPCWKFLSFTSEWGLTLLYIRGETNSKKKTLLEGINSFICSLCLRVGCVGISKVFVVSTSILPSSKLLVQANKNNKNNKIMSDNQWDFLPCQKCIGVPYLPVVLLFGKMNGERREQSRAGTQLETVQNVWGGEGSKGCSKVVVK